MRIAIASKGLTFARSIICMKKLFFLILLVFFHSEVNSQFQPLTYYIPNNYTILDSLSRDINNDKIKDLVLILKHNQEEDNFDTTRPLLLLEGNNQGLYRLMAKNDNVVLCKECGGVYGDPFEGISIENRGFTLDFRGGSRWRWTRHISFKFDKISSRFILYKDIGIDYDGANPEGKIDKKKYNKKDFGRLPFTKYNYEKSE